jgi:carbon monoxide dehydrogenase subunit G
MAKLIRKVQINAPKDEVWSMIADLGGIVNFHPFVDKSYYTTDQKEGVNAARICELNMGMTVEETALKWVEGKSVTLGIEYIKGPKPPFLSDFTGTIIVRDDGKGGSIVNMEMDWQENFGPLGWAMGNFMVKPQFSKMVPPILNGLKHHAETGEVVDGEVANQVRNLATAMS